MAQVSLTHIQKHYGTPKSPGPMILKDLSILINEGEFIVVVGPSGCGKSTLLRVIAGLETPSGGEIHIGDTDVTHLEPAERNIAMVFQNYALYPHMSVRKNMAYGAKLAKMPKAEIDARIASTAKMLDIKAILGKKPNALSGGQRQRVAMGRAIMRKPKLFLFDEPLSNLDAKLRTSTRLEIRKRHNTIQTTSLYVTHDQTEAMTLADRIIVMNRGKIEQFDTPEAIFHRPATMFVANFMGSPAMNLIPVTLKDLIPHSDGTALTNLPLPAPVVDAPHKRWILGIRPEHFNLLSPADAKRIKTPDEPIWPIMFQLHETLGSEALLYGTLGSTPITLRIPSTSLTHLATLKMGEPLWVTPKADALHWFDPETEQRLSL